MSTLRIVTQHTTALLLALSLAACSGTAQVNDTSGSPKADAKSDATELATPYGDKQAKASEDLGILLDTEAPNPEDMESEDLGILLDTEAPDPDKMGKEIMDDKPADKLFEEEVVSWEALNKGKRGNPEDEPPIGWEGQEGYEVLGDKQLRIYFPSGSRECFGHRVEVTETDKEVNIKLIQGFLHESSDKACTTETTYRTMVIDLKQPLGDRKVVSAKTEHS